MACVLWSDTSLVKITVQCHSALLAHARPTMFYIPLVITTVRLINVGQAQSHPINVQKSQLVGICLLSKEEMLLHTSHLTTVHSGYEIAVTITLQNASCKVGDCMNFKPSFETLVETQGVFQKFWKEQEKEATCIQLRWRYSWPTAVLIYPGLFQTLVGFVWRLI